MSCTRKIAVSLVIGLIEGDHYLPHHCPAFVCRSNLCSQALEWILRVRYPGSGSCKVWVCLFTCCIARAVHLDLVPNLTTAAFIRCLKRFVAQKRPPEEIDFQVCSSDNTYLLWSPIVTNGGRSDAVPPMVGDIVVAKKDGKPRGFWRLARVESIVVGEMVNPEVRSWRCRQGWRRCSDNCNGYTHWRLLLILKTHRQEHVLPSEPSDHNYTNTTGNRIAAHTNKTWRAAASRARDRICYSRRWLLIVCRIVTVTFSYPMHSLTMSG